MSKVFGTPIFVFSADDPANKAQKGNGKEPVSSKLQDVVKNLRPLEKAQSALENAARALDGTAYEEIQNSIQALMQKITSTTQQIVVQLSGDFQQNSQVGTPTTSQQPMVPTVGQISGREPLPDVNNQETLPKAAASTGKGQRTEG